MPSRRVVVDLADPATLPPRPSGTHFRFAYMGDAHSKVAHRTEIADSLRLKISQIKQKNEHRRGVLTHKFHGPFRLC